MLLLSTTPRVHAVPNLLFSAVTAVSSHLSYATDEMPPFLAKLRRSMAKSAGHPLAGTVAFMSLVSATAQSAKMCLHGFDGRDQVLNLDALNTVIIAPSSWGKSPLHKVSIEKPLTFLSELLQDATEREIKRRVSQQTGGDASGNARHLSDRVVDVQPPALVELVVVNCSAALHLVLYYLHTLSSVFVVSQAKGRGLTTLCCAATIEGRMQLLQSQEEFNKADSGTHNFGRGAQHMISCAEGSGFIEKLVSDERECFLCFILLLPFRFLALRGALCFVISLASDSFPLKFQVTSQTSSPCSTDNKSRTSPPQMGAR